MRVLATKVVVTYLVQFSDEETVDLRRLGWVPRNALGRAELWLQQEQVAEWQKILRDQIPYPT